VHMDLEAKIAQFMGTPDSILYSYGLATVSSVIPAFCKRGDLILAYVPLLEWVPWFVSNGSVHIAMTLCSWESFVTVFHLLWMENVVMKV